MERRWADKNSERIEAQSVWIEFYDVFAIDARRVAFRSIWIQNARAFYRTESRCAPSLGRKSI